MMTEFGIHYRLSCGNLWVVFAIGARLVDILLNLLQPGEKHRDLLIKNRVVLAELDVGFPEKNQKFSCLYQINPSDLDIALPVVILNLSIVLFISASTAFCVLLDPV